MIISMKLHATREEIDEVCEQVKHFGYKVHSIEGEERVVIGVVGVGDVTACMESIEAMPQVEKVVRISAPYKSVSREFRKEKTRMKVGARNMQNFMLLKALGKCGRPVLLKRGLSSTVKELLMSAEYIVAHGNPDVILCERGIRTYETATRNTCDISAIPVLNELTHLPVILDPSHATGRRSLVPAVSRAGVAIGADGLIVEVHPAPEKAMSDGAQSLDLAQFQKMMRELQPYLELWRESRKTQEAAASAGRSSS